MKTDLGLLKVKRVIIHEVPRKSSDGAAILSEVESPLTQEVRGMLRDRLIAGVGSPRHGFDIEWDPKTTSPVPEMIVSYASDPGAVAFVQKSQAIANHLYNSQPSISPAGVLTILECDLGGRVALAVMKIEKQEGARLIKTASGKKTFDIRYFRDLILTPRTRVFKLAIFADIGDGFECRGCDNQRSYTQYKELADFFLHQFLGCRMAQVPSVATKTFYEATAEFIKTHFAKDPERHAEMYCHLRSELSSEKSTLSPRRFSDHFLPMELRQEYLDFLKEKGLGSGSFDLDTTLVQPRLRKTTFNFRSGTTLIVPGEETSDRVQLENQMDGLVKVEFTDQLTDVRGK